MSGLQEVGAGGGGTWEEVCGGTRHCIDGDRRLHGMRMRTTSRLLISALWTASQTNSGPKCPVKTVVIYVTS